MGFLFISDTLLLEVMFKKILGILFIVGLLGSGILYAKRVQISEYLRGVRKEPLPIAVSFEDVNKAPVSGTGTKPVAPPSAANPEPKDPQAPAPTALPETLNLAVPFTSQAPNGNWDQPYQDACEEASVAMVHYFFSKKSFTPDSADKEILDMVAFEESRFGYGYDITAEETAKVIKSFYGYKKVELITDPTPELIKSVLAKGLPIVVPVYGRALGNPYFTPPGPTYHMLVIKGYTQDKFITNDPGTKRGADYLYPYGIMMNAIHDWNGGDVSNGRKVIIVIHPN